MSPRADRITEPARTVRIVARPDVCVLGAGAAGIAAAVAAARRGAEVLLVDAEPFVGGLATFGLINLLLTLDDGDGHQVVAGLCQEVVDRLGDRAVRPPPEQWNSEDPGLVDRWRRWGLVWGAPESVRYSVAFDPEDFVDVALDLLTGAGVRLQLMTWAADVVVSPDGGRRRVDAVLTHSKAGREAVVAGAYVDATGDGDVLAAAGAVTERVDIPPHLWFRAAGVDPGVDPGELAFRTTAPGRVLVPWGPDPVRVDATDPRSVTDALLRCRRSAREAFATMARRPGWEHAWFDDHARLLGVTESRRLVGDHVLTREEAVTAGEAGHPDAVARTGHWTRRGVVWDIPPGALTSPRLTNVVAAGRCISTTRYVHQATKEIPAAMATGEAAGVIAAMAAGAPCDVHDVDVGRVRSVLRASGAIVGPV